MKTYTDYAEPIGVSFPQDSHPGINSRHVDGPLLYFSDGQLHWLTLLERIQFAFGFTDAEKLERKHRPNLIRLLGR